MVLSRQVRKERNMIRRRKLMRRDADLALSLYLKVKQGKKKSVEFEERMQKIELKWVWHPDVWEEILRTVQAERGVFIEVL